ncbi:hypothetical protein [Streptomyces sp. bgisy095]|uniref:hypothetical protein n=1 Tax=unclassified Streptomyces TaxID=2593676 RepID=UPI003D7149F4
MFGNTMRRIGAAGTVASLAGAALVVGGTATTTQADTGCDWGTITINGDTWDSFSGTRIC